ncbi:MAG: alpha/beta fold hydrolase [Candidatus Sungbacteria bacterium]|uniref:Alpha/beta fold hydrolase n=1 Tax=Candidatus Sungiibacteriota bacterium TaxID=2750080 RepID=A0A932QXZ8_9BACT|nr:alpha/beta fold hydrolase [Candidatus Sungbacteria bacterium]
MVDALGQPSSSVSGRRLRVFLMTAVAAAGFGLGVVFALPVWRADVARVQIRGVTLEAEVAADAASQTRGLSGTDRIAEKSGMLFLFDRPDRYGIWMKAMRFPIDILWMRNGAVADMEERVAPPAAGMADVDLPVYVPDTPADMVLEVAAGFSAAHGIRIGDAVKIDFRGKTLASGVSPVADPPAGSEYTIAALRQDPARGSNFTVLKVLEASSAYQKFLISYDEAGVGTLTGVMNVPREPVPEGGFPVLVLNHGLIRPEIYFPGRGSQREQNFFSRHGYVTIQPDYRGYSSTTPAFPAHHDFYVGYTRDALALIDALKQGSQSLMDTTRIGMWGHSMGGGIAARAAVLTHDVRAFVLFAPISADAQDNFYELSVQEIDWLHQTYGPAGSSLYREISPLTYFSDIAAPVQLHHGGADRVVPISFSEKMFATLRRDGKGAEYFIYPGEAHEFIDAWPLAASRSLQFFDTYVKNAR